MAHIVEFSGAGYAFNILWISRSMGADNRTPLTQGQCSTSTYPLRLLSPPWCDSFTCRSSDYELFQTWLFAYTVLVIGLGQGFSDPAL